MTATIFSQKEQELGTIIEEERLKPEETKKFIENSMQAGEFRTYGTEIVDLMPKLSRFESDRPAKKAAVVNRLKSFFDKFLGLG